MIMSPVTLCGYETWSLALREGNGCRVFEDMVLRRIFGVTRDEVTGENCTVRRCVISSLRQIYEEDEICEAWTGHGGGENNNSIEKPGWKRPLRRPRHRWKDNRL
jgi:hypothetical protein